MIRIGELEPVVVQAIDRNRPRSARAIRRRQRNLERESFIDPAGIRCFQPRAFVDECSIEVRIRTECVEAAHIESRCIRSRGIREEIVAGAHPGRSGRAAINAGGFARARRAEVVLQVGIEELVDHCDAARRKSADGGDVGGRVARPIVVDDVVPAVRGGVAALCAIGGKLWI